MPQLAKLALPRSSRAVERPRLFARLDRARRTSGAVWVAGPPGSGKTTLVASWIRARRPPAAWLRLDAADADPAGFFHYLALAARGATRSRAALPVLLPEQGEDLDAFARLFFRNMYGLLPRGTVLALDDCHSLPSRNACDAILRAALEELPRGIALVLMSRGEPPASLARGRAHGALQVIAGSSLELTAKESWSLALRNGFAGGRAQLESLRRAVHGWAAGLVILMARRTWNPVDRGATFDYFAGEVFDRIDPEARRVLLEAALLESPTAPLVERVTGNPDSAKTLSNLARENLFTIQHKIDPPAYEFHALFRDFLLARGREELPPGRAAEVRCAAARILAAGGPDQTDKAIGLFAEAGAHEEMVPLVIREAPALLATGRWQTVERWIARLPADVRDTNPWILHLAGAALVPRDPAEAREHQERALAAFEEAGDSAGVWLAWIAAVDSVLFEWNIFTPLSALLQRYERLSARFPFPSPEIQGRVTAAAFLAAAFHMPDHPGLPAWSQGVRAIASSAAPPVVRLLAGSYLCAFEAFMLGEIERNRELIRELRPLVQQPATPPMARLSWFVLIMAYLFQAGDIEACAAVPAEADAAADEYGVHQLEPMSRLWEFLIALYRSPEKLPDAIAGMERGLRPRQAAYASNLSFARAAAAFRRGDIRASVKLGEDAFARADACGYPPTKVLAQLLLARARARNGDVAGAWRDLSAAREYGERIGSSWIGLVAPLIEAELLLDGADPGAAFAPLAQAFSIAREKGVHPFLVFAAEDAARLCGEALARGIETEFVAGFVRRYRLRPPGALSAPAAWPWPVRIRAMGPFEVEIEGQPLGDGRRSPRKPMELLRALVALGGRDVHEAAITEALWPHRDGDAAQQALETTLHRLRRIIGQDSIVHRDHKLTIRTDRCWVDALELDERLGASLAALERGRAANGPSPTTISADAQRIATLYRGPLLQGDGAPWVAAGREWLQRKLLRWLASLKSVPGDPADVPELRRRIELVDDDIAGLDAP